MLFRSPKESAVLGRDLEPGPGVLSFMQQRPSGCTVGPAIAGPGISRRQLIVRETKGAVIVERVGRCATLVNGAPCEKTVLTPGDTLLLRGQLLLLCVERPSALEASLDFAVALAPRFGAADALGLVGESPAAWELRDQLAFAAKTGDHVLVTGSTGTGKELASRAIHALSARAAGPFVSRNAATLPPGLVDAELFGNVRNYPNPGTAERKGLIGEADGGTLFLDEIGELPFELQSHLLRVLDGSGEYQRLGESLTRRANLRLIAATNRDPSELKHDLVPRLAVRVELPSLSDRLDDVPLLIRHGIELARKKAPDVVQRFCDEQGRPSIDPALVDVLLRRAMPGNVRDIASVLWAAMAESKRGTIRVPRELASAAPVPNPPPGDLDADRVREAITRRHGNLQAAATDLGLSSRYALYRIVRKLRIPLAELRS